MNELKSCKNGVLLVNECCVGFSYRSCTFSKSCQRICTFGSKQAIYLTHQGLGRVEPSGEEVSLLCFVPPQVQPLPPDVTLWYCTRSVSLGCWFSGAKQVWANIVFSFPGSCVHWGNYSRDLNPLSIGYLGCHQVALSIQELASQSGVSPAQPSPLDVIWYEPDLAGRCCSGRAAERWVRPLVL